MTTESDKAGESRLRGKDLGGAEQKQSPEHAAFKKQSNPDTELRVDGEPDSLYQDGLDIEVESRPLTGADGVDDTH